MIIPQPVDCRAVATHCGFVDDVVVDKRRIVEELDGSSGGNEIWGIDVAEEAAAEDDDYGPDLLAFCSEVVVNNAVHQLVGGLQSGRNQRIEIGKLRSYLLLDFRKCRHYLR